MKRILLAAVNVNLLNYCLFVLLVSCCFNTSNARAIRDSTQIKGSPRVIHYTKKQFNSDSQFWGMCQDADGNLYYGNNDGTLIFDGERWQLVRLPNRSSVRALKASREGIVYVGGFNEFGVIKKDGHGQYYYESLIGLLRAEDRDIANVLQIHEVQGQIVFRAYKLLIAIANNKAVTLPSSSYFSFSKTIGNRLFVKDQEGLKTLDLESREFTKIFPYDDLNNEEMVSVLSGFHTNELLVVTKQGSVFMIDSIHHKATFWQRLLPENSNNLITSALRSSDGNYYLGTLRTQILTLTETRGHLEVRNTFPSLQDNTVLNLHETRDGNVWALLNNGIDCIDISSPVSTLFENASTYDAYLLPENRMYLATNQGVFYSDVIYPNDHSMLHYENITGLEGQAWLLQRFHDKILCSHDRGLFALNKNAFRKIPGVEGVWKVLPIENKPDHYLVCTYNGLHLMRFVNGNFTILHKLEGFSESCRDIIQTDEPGVFWVCHGYKGVFRIKIEDSYKRVISIEHFKDKNGLPSAFNVNVFKWRNDIVFTTNAGIFIYNEKENKFKPHEFLTKLLGTALNVRKLFEYKERTWFVHDNEVGYFITDARKPVLEKGLFLQLKGSFNSSMECIVPVGDDCVLVGNNIGLYAFDLTYRSSITQAKTIINSIRYRQDANEVLAPVESSKLSRQSFPYNSHGIIFNFSVPAFLDRTNIQYSYKVDGVGDMWSDWQQTSQKEYSLLRPGKYTFRVRARSLLGENAAEAVYYFTVLPAWYQTTWAFLIYFIAAFSGSVLLMVRVRRKIEREQQKTLLEEREKRKVLELELERIKLEKEKEEIKKDKDQLEEDVIYKSKELANYTMLLVKKRELLTEINDELAQLKELSRSDASRQKIRDLTKKISANLQNEEHIQVFEANFERVHHVFFTELKTSFPDLNQKELRLCAFVRMNLTNKEIASILNISVRGVETARYRLRKRLSLAYDEDMVEFLDKLYSSNSTMPENEETNEKATSF